MKIIIEGPNGLDLDEIVDIGKKNFCIILWCLSSQLIIFGGWRHITWSPSPPIHSPQIKPWFTSVCMACLHLTWMCTIIDATGFILVNSVHVA